MKPASEAPQPSRKLGKQVAELATVLLLAAAVTASGIWVTDAKHRARQLFVELEELNQQQDRLQIDWGRLQIEQSTWASERLHLTTPADEQLVVVETPK